MEKDTIVAQFRPLSPGATKAEMPDGAFAFVRRRVKPNVASRREETALPLSRRR